MNLLYSSRRWLAVFGTCLSSIGFAATPVITGGRALLTLTPGDATLWVETRDGKRELSFDSKNSLTVEMDADTSVAVVVSGANPVLFSYAAKDIVKTPTDNKVAADKLGDALAGFIDHLSPTPAGAGTAFARGERPSGGTAAARVPSKVLLDNVDVVALGDSIGWVMKTWNSAGATIDNTVSANTVVIAKQTASDWRTKLAGSSNPTKALGAISEIWRKLVTSSETIHWRVEYTDGGRAEEGDSTRDHLADDLSTRGNVANGKLYIDLIFAIEPERRAILAEVTDISDLADSITQIDDKKLTSVTYDTANKQLLPIEVSANARFAPLMLDTGVAKKYQAARAGTYNVTFAPHDWIHIRPSLGVIYSFVKSPSFSATRDSSGQLHVDGNVDDYAEYSGLVAMDFVPDRYFRVGVQPFLQLGVSPSSDNLGLVLGGGIRAYQSFTFSLGVVYQRVKKLSGSLKIGDPIQQESDLKTSKEFKAGLYLGVGVKLK